MTPWIPDVAPTFPDYFAVVPGALPVLPVVAGLLALLYMVGA